MYVLGEKRKRTVSRLLILCQAVTFAIASNLLLESLSLFCSNLIGKFQDKKSSSEMLSVQKEVKNYIILEVKGTVITSSP